MTDKEDSGKNNKTVKLCDIRLGVVCPMANERSTAVEFVKSALEQCKGFKSVVFFAVFDNTCKDGSMDLLKNMRDETPQLQVVWAPENECVVDAYVRGYREALNAGCDWILEIDAGFSHQPAEIPQFFYRMKEGYDCVFGSRFCAGGKFTDAPLHRYIISRWGSIIANVLLGTRLKDMTSGFELFTGAALREALAKGIHSRGHFFQTEIKVHCRSMKIVEVPIHYCSPSQNVNTGIMLDAFGNLFRLFRKRLSGSL